MLALPNPEPRADSLRAVRRRAEQHAIAAEQHDVAERILGQADACAPDRRWQPRLGLFDALPVRAGKAPQHAAVVVEHRATVARADVVGLAAEHHDAAELAAVGERAVEPARRLWRRR